MKRQLFAFLIAVTLAAASIGTASAHRITVDPSANGAGQGQGTEVVAGGGPAHCKAQAPASESSDVVSFTPPGPICD
jgi:hypothetical protein